MMKIRAIEPADAEEWLRMRTALWPDGAHAREIQAFFDYGPSPGLAAVFVCEQRRGVLIGFVEAGMRSYAEGCNASPVPYIEGWYVDVSHRRRGVGARLIGAVETWARERGFRELASDVELDNAVSIAAHEALGYEEVSRLVCFRRELR